MNIARSETTLINEEAMRSLAISMQRPVVCCSQILRLGVQCIMLASVYAE